MPCPAVIVDAADLSPEQAAGRIPLRPLYSTSSVPLPPYAQAVGFKASSGSLCLLPTSDGSAIAEVLFGLGDGQDPYSSPYVAGDLARKLPVGVYHLVGDFAEDAKAVTDFALAWAVGAYSFDRYKSGQGEGQSGGLARLEWPALASRFDVETMSQAFALVRDLVNTPAADMGPQELEDAARALATQHGADFSAIVGQDLLAAGYPAIYAVGQSSPRAPRLLDLRWGSLDAPKVTIVGKGIVFDTGGLDLKPASAMKLMKKDMGGAAHALGVAALVMAHRLPVRLRVLLPVAENAVSGSAMRPGDVLQTRKGLTIEVNNTDAEGRLILADALAEADSEAPAWLIDFATLTGAARVALGTDLPALLCNNDALADSLLGAGVQTADPLWRLPLWAGYRSQVESKIADLDNAPEGGMAGAITAGLFLERFVSTSTPWAHIDTYAWAARARPGHPVGGNALGMRAVFTALKNRFG